MEINTNIKTCLSDVFIKKSYLVVLHFFESSCVKCLYKMFYCSKCFIQNNIKADFREYYLVILVISIIKKKLT